MTLTALILFASIGADDSLPAVVGTVVDAQNQPVAGADIYVFDGPPVGRTVLLDDAAKTRRPPALVARARSNADGEFSVALPVYAPPVYARSMSWLALAVHKPGLAVKMRLIARYWPSRAAPIRIVLTSPRNNRVRVRSPGDEPVADARLWVDQIDGIPLPAELSERLVTESNASGEAELPDVVGDELRTVRVQSPQFGWQWSALARSSGNATAIRLLPVGSISGQLIDDEGNALCSTRVRLATWVEPRDELSGGGLAEATTDAEGRFHVPAIAAGVLQLAAELPANSPLVSTYQDTQQIDAGMTNEVVVRFNRGVRVQGTVIDQEGGPIAGAPVEIVSFNVPRRYLQLESDEAGKFSGYVVPGHVGRAVVRLPPDYYLPAHSMAALAVPEGAAEMIVEPLRLAVGTTFAGQVVDSAGRPVADAEVVGELPRPDIAMPDTASRVFFSLSDRDGNFMLQNVPPNGKLSLTAVSISGVTAAPVEVSVRGADWVTVTVTPDVALSASGRAVDAEGHPVAGASVRVIAATRERRPRETDLLFHGSGQIHTDADGRFAIAKQLPPDQNYRVEVDAPGMMPVRTETIDPTVWHALDFGDIVLAPTPQLRSVAGQVLDEDSRPIGGAVVSQSGDGPRRTRTICDADGRFRIEGIYDGPAWLFVERDGRRLQAHPIAEGASDPRIVLGENIAAEPRDAARAPAELRAEEAVIRGLLNDYRSRLERWPDDWPYAGPQLIAAVEAILQGELDEAGRQALLYLANDVELRLSYLLSPEQLMELARAAPDRVHRAWLYEAASDRLAESPDLQRAALAQALLAARAIEQPSYRIMRLTSVAERLFDLGDREAGAALVREARERQDAAHEGLHLSEDWRGRLAGGLVYVDLPAAFALCEKLSVNMHDACLNEVACSLAAENPAAAERAIELMRSSSLGFNGYGALQRMGAVDPQRAVRIARKRSLANVRADGLAVVAHAQARVNSALAANLLEEAYQQLEQSLASGTAVSPGSTCGTAAALLPVVERVAPAMLDHYLARSLAMRPPRPARGDPSGQYESVIAGMALAIVPYDRRTARALIEPMAARMRTLAAGRAPSAWSSQNYGRLWAAFALVDPAWARQLIATLPAAPPEVAVSPRASAARLVIIALLYRGADRGPWVYRQYLGRRHPDLPAREF